MFKVKYVEFIMMLVRLDLNLIVSLFHHKCEVSETVSTTTLVDISHKPLSQCSHVIFLFQQVHVTKMRLAEN